MSEAIFFVFLISVSDNLCVGARAELMAPADQFFPQSSKIIDLSVEGYPYRSILISQRLVSSGQIDNAQATMSEEDERTFLIERPNVFA
jgi:hypothetical protein